MPQLFILAAEMDIGTLAVPIAAWGNLLMGNREGERASVRAAVQVPFGCVFSDFHQPPRSPINNLPFSVFVFQIPLPLPQKPKPPNSAQTNRDTCSRHFQQVATDEPRVKLHHY